MRFARLVGSVALVMSLLQITTASAQAAPPEVSAKLWYAYGGPCVDCWVTLERAGIPIARTMTDSSGMFSFRGIKPGDYVVRVDLEGFDQVTTRLEVGPLGLMGPSTIFLEPKQHMVPAPQNQ